MQQRHRNIASNGIDKQVIEKYLKKNLVSIKKRSTFALDFEREITKIVRSAERRVN